MLNASNIFELGDHCQDSQILGEAELRGWFQAGSPFKIWISYQCEEVRVAVLQARPVSLGTCVAHGGLMLRVLLCVKLIKADGFTVGRLCGPRNPKIGARSWRSKGQKQQAQVERRTTLLLVTFYGHVTS